MTTTDQVRAPRQTTPFTPPGAALIAGAPAAYLLLLAVVLVRPLLPAIDPQHDYAAQYGYDTSVYVAVGAAVLGLISTLLWPRTRLGPAATLMRTAVLVLCLWASAGLVLDGFRFFFWSTGIPAGDFGLIDGRGALTRAAAGLALVMTTVTLVRLRGATPRTGARKVWPGAAAAMAAFAYPMLKYYWALGGTVARPVPYDEGFPYAETVLLFGGVTLSLLLIRGFANRVLQLGLVCSGWLVTLVAVNQGALPLFGMVNYAVGGARPDVLNDQSSTWWVVAVVYGTWAVLGLLVGLATINCHPRENRSAGRDLQ